MPLRKCSEYHLRYLAKNSLVGFSCYTGLYKWSFSDILKRKPHTNSNVCYDTVLSARGVPWTRPDINEYISHAGWMMRMRFNYLKCPFGQGCHFEISGFDLLQVFSAKYGC